MKRKLLAAMVIMVLLTGCADGAAGSSSPLILPDDLEQTVPSSQEPVPTAEPTAAPTTMPEVDIGGGLKTGGENHPIGKRTVVDGKMQSYLTGEWKDAGVVQRRNMAVMMANNKAALPQYGVSRASVFYEAPMEKWSTTRLMVLLEDYDDLDRIGPVRSSRDYFVYEAMAYGSIYCNWGLAVPYAGPLFNDKRIDHISQGLAGQANPTGMAFIRVPRVYANGKAYATEYTGYMSVSEYTKGVQLRGYATEYKSNFEQAFTFADEGYIAAYDTYPDATKLYPGGKSNGGGGYQGDGMYPCFTYNEEERLYYRTQFNADHVDEQNGEQLAVTNVVFKICVGDARDENGYLMFNVHGSGEAYVFTNGKVIKGTWRRDSDYEPNLFLDENGSEIVFNQGKTWICCIGENYAKNIYFE